MERALHLQNSVLLVRIPEDVFIPEYQDKPRPRKAILRAVIQTLQTKTLELLYAGPQKESVFEKYAGKNEGIFVSINVLDDGKCDFTISQDVLLKRFKRELQYNNEHILIDNTSFANGVYQRHIQLYIRSRRSDKKPVPAYTFSASGNFASA
ncbi:MAG: hypothetical protein EOO51_06990 [Flavobacterium sp.]|nr:MAG: hypothetical protein EOO51_06990 [Flavobacterium sp.]